MKSLRLSLVAWCAFSSVCTAQFIPGVTTTTNMGTWFSYNIANLTNGVGLSAMTISATHSANWQDMWISNQITTGWLQFDLGAVVQLSGARRLELQLVDQPGPRRPADEPLHVDGRHQLHAAVGSDRAAGNRRAHPGLLDRHQRRRGAVCQVRHPVELR
jgi:hypothetical protein